MQTQASAARQHGSASAREAQHSARMRGGSPYTLERCRHLRLHLRLRLRLRRLRLPCARLSCPWQRCVAVRVRLRSVAAGVCSAATHRTGCTARRTAAGRAGADDSAPPARNAERRAAGQPREALPAAARGGATRSAAVRQPATALVAISAAARSGSALGGRDDCRRVGPPAPTASRERQVSAAPCRAAPPPKGPIEPRSMAGSVLWNVEAVAGVLNRSSGSALEGAATVLATGLLGACPPGGFAREPHEGRQEQAVAAGALEALLAAMAREPDHAGAQYALIAAQGQLDGRAADVSRARCEGRRAPTGCAGAAQAPHAG